MRPKEVLQLWIKAFNEADLEALINLYDDFAVNHQVANEAIEGKYAIKKMFEVEFANAEMVCKPVNIFEEGDWAIMEWQDPKGLRGCGFFKIEHDKIILQRGYWDKLSFHRLYNIPL